jgi:Kef-type K+ transport system membrane component KefB
VIASFVGIRFAPRVFDLIYERTRTDGVLVALALIFVLMVATLADVAGLAPVVGAFVAGLALGPYKRADAVAESLAPVGHLLIPVFFLQIGITANVRGFFSADVLWPALALLAVAILGKVLSGFAAGKKVGDKLLIGFGMLPRGEVGLIFAGLGLREAIVDQTEYGVLLFVVLVTTLLAPPLLKMRLRSGARSSSGTPA